MTTISEDDIGRALLSPARQQSPEELARARSRRFWIWTSTAWATSVSVTAVVAANQAVTVAIGGMTLAALGNALSHPESAAESAVVEPAAPAASESGAPTSGPAPLPMAAELAAAESGLNPL